MTTLATWSAWTFSCSMSVSRATARPRKSCGTVRVTVPGSSDLGGALLDLALVAQEAVDRPGNAPGGGQVGLRRESFSRLSRRSGSKGTSRSMMAPLGIRPVVGTPRVTVSASPGGAEKPPTATGPWATA